MALHIAMEHLRLRDELRILWIDSLCIDQANYHEKNKQVQLMRFIYSSAWRVLVWLGPAMKERRGSYADDFGAWRRRCQLYLIFEELWNILPSIENIFRADWWNRVWVIQEVAMASSDPLVGRGHEWVPWLCFQYANELFECLHMSATNDRDPLAADIFRRLIRYNLRLLIPIRGTIVSGTRESLDFYLRCTWQFNASNEVDRVYALLGLARDKDLSNLIPDYSLDSIHLGTKVVQHFIDVDGSLNILSFYRKPLGHASTSANLGCSKLDLKETITVS